MNWYIVALGTAAWIWWIYDWYTTRRRKPTEEPKARGGKNPFAGITKDEIASLMPPCEVHASEPWDRFWQTQIKFGVVGFTDLFVDDRGLLCMAAARGFQTVLCVGSGLSLEPHALAAAGLKVTVLDISPLV